MHLKVFVLVCLFSLAFASNYDDYIEEPEYVEKSEEYVEEPDVSIILTNENFAETIKTNNYFVKFYAPWCGRLRITWEQLAQLFNRDEESRVRIAEVDCTVSSETCDDNEIEGCPTLQLFKINNEETVKYDSDDRDLPSLIQFINEQLGLPETFVDSVEDVEASTNGQLGSSLPEAVVDSIKAVPAPTNGQLGSLLPEAAEDSVKAFPAPTNGQMESSLPEAVVDSVEDVEASTNGQLGSSLPEAVVDSVKAVPAPTNGQLGSLLPEAAEDSVKAFPAPTNGQMESSLPEAVVDSVEDVEASTNGQLGSSLPEAAVDSVETVPTPMNAHVELTGKNIATVTGTGKHFVKFYVILSVLLMTR